MSESSEKISSPRVEPKNVPKNVKDIAVLKVVSQSPSQNEPREKIYKFDKERIVVGSVVSADIRLSEPGISPIHAVIEMERESQSGRVFCTVYDLASDTGVFVNRKKVITHKLMKNDVITIGMVQFQFYIETLDTSSMKDRIRQSEGRALFLNPHEDFTPLLLEDEREVIEIFDFSATSKRCLEVVMSWCGVILTVEHFVSEKEVTVGHTLQSDFGIPPLLSASHYPIVIQHQGEFVLNLDSRMVGVVHQSGQLKPLDEVRSGAMRGPSGYEIPIGNNDFAKITIGDIDFYFSFTAAPPRLKRRKVFDRDPFFLKIFSISMLLTAVTVVTLFQVKVPVSVEPEQVPDRIASILYQPEKFMNPPPVLKLDKSSEAPKTQPKPQAASQAPAKKGLRGNPKEVHSDLLKGASGKIQNILGNSLTPFEGGGKNLKGVGGFSAHGALGSGGLALSGNEAGGGGKIQSSLARVGTGLKATGTGTSIVGSEVRVGIRTTSSEETVVMGAIDRDAIAAAIFAHKDEFRLCYEREINAEHPHLSGQIGTRFVIGASGRVTQAGIESSSLNNPNAERCILLVLKRIDFPIPQGGGVVEVRFPFKFSAAVR